MKHTPASHRTFCVLHQLACPPDLRRQSLIAVHAVMAMRLCVLCCQAGEDPSPGLAQRFGSLGASDRFRLLMTTIDAGWPDTFCVSRPCCMKMSPDETLVASLVDAVVVGQRAIFDLRSAEMLNGELRDQIWIRIVAWLESLPGPQSL